MSTLLNICQHSWCQHFWWLTVMPQSPKLSHYSRLMYNSPERYYEKNTVYNIELPKTYLLIVLDVNLGLHLDAPNQRWEFLEIIDLDVGNVPLSYLPIEKSNQNTEKNRFHNSRKNGFRIPNLGFHYKEQFIHSSFSKKWEL